MNDKRRLALGSLALVIALLAGGFLDRSAAQNKPEGEMRWALYVTLSPVWFDPGEVVGQITPFWVSEHCNPEVDDLIDRQAREIDTKKRLLLVIQIQHRREADVPKPILGWRFGYFVQWPYVKNLVPHHVIYNYARLQEGWLAQYASSRPQGAGGGE